MDANNFCEWLESVSSPLHKVQITSSVFVPNSGLLEAFGTKRPPALDGRRCLALATNIRFSSNLDF